MRTDAPKETGDRPDSGPGGDDGKGGRDQHLSKNEGEGDGGKQLGNGTELPPAEPKGEPREDPHFQSPTPPRSLSGTQRTRGPRDADEAREFQREDLEHPNSG